MVWFGRSEPIVMLALPPTRGTAAPRLTVARLNCTVPAGAPTPGVTGVTVAVRMTGWPKGTGVLLAARAVAVEALLTFWPPTTEPVLLPKLALSGVKVAKTVWAVALAASELVAYCAVVPVRGTVSTFVPSILKTTLPVGVPAPDTTGATVAVKVTVWPDTDGLRELVTLVVVAAAKVAVTDLAALMVSWQVDLPVQSPDHPANAELAASTGAAVRVTRASLAKSYEHVVPQSIP